MTKLRCFLVVSLIVLEVGVSFFFRLECSVVIDRLKSTAMALYSDSVVSSSFIASGVDVVQP